MTRGGTALLKGLKQVEDNCEAGLYGPALDVLNLLLAGSPANPALLVRKAQLIQLSDSETGEHTLDEARACLNLAVRIDPAGSLPQTEQAYFTYAVDDDAERAEKQFRRAVAACKRLLREALVGHAKALAELGREGGAFECLAEAERLPADGTHTDKALLEEFRAILRSSNSPDF